MLWVNNLLEYCAQLGFSSLVLYSLALAVVMELTTVVLRFGAGLLSSRCNAWMGRFTFGVRVHHGYFGILLGMLAVWPLSGLGGLRNLLLIIAAALIISDVIHHFLVLRLLVGTHEFDLFYPPRQVAERSTHDAEESPR
jgi:hypothetical protein